MNVDIFIKTHQGDDPWMYWCLQLIAKHARGFRRVVVVNDGGGFPPGISFLNGAVIACSKPPPMAGRRHRRAGYDWQQAVKLKWTDFTNADAVLILDSDMILKAPLSPEMFSRDGHPWWWHRLWSEAGGGGHIHKPAADHFVGLATTHCHMAGPAFFMTREATVGCQRYMLERFGQTPYEYVFDEAHPNPSEFQMFGAYLKHVDAHGYVFVHPIHDVADVHAWPVRQFWSWGGITPAVQAELEEIAR